MLDFDLLTEKMLVRELPERRERAEFLEPPSIIDTTNIRVK
jgi:hypothetical protein